MDWYLAPGAFEAAFAGSCAPSVRPLVKAGSAAHRVPAGAPLTDIDLQLIALIYGFLGADSPCARCGAPLDRGLRLIRSPGLATPAPWRVQVRTRCRGWRRHRHVAEVTRRRHLELGPFRRR